MAKKVNNKISEKAAVELLGRLFANATSDELTLDEVYAAANRADRDPETNRNWLNGILAKLRDHNLVTVISKYENSRSKLDKVKLSAVGKYSLGWPGGEANNSVVSIPAVPRVAIVTYNDLAKAVAGFRKDNPDFDVVFEVRLKELVDDRT